MDFANLIKAREVLGSIWKESDLKGRCWGPTREDNPYVKSNITLAIGEELISVSQNQEGELIIHEFVKTKGTSLGKTVRKILLSAKLPVEN